MSNIVPIVCTLDSITVIVNGKPYVSKKGDLNYDALKEAVENGDYEGAAEMATNPGFIAKWSDGYFKWTQERVTFRGEEVPKALEDRMMKVARDGKDPRPLMRFWENLQENPSYRSVQQLYPFLSHQNIPITADGHLLAYKGVNEDYTDCHSRKFVNKPGAEIFISRNQVDDNPNNGCSKGFHVGALEYAKGYGQRRVICKIHPRDVVSIPSDSSFQKMRVCRYTVVGDFDGKPLPSTVIGIEEEPAPLPDANIVPVEEVDHKPVERPKKAKSAQQKLDLPDPDFDKMNKEALAKVSLGKLRKYATRIGVERASKIPGGKDALIDAIATRRNLDGWKEHKAKKEAKKAPKKNPKGTPKKTVAKAKAPKKPPVKQTLGKTTNVSEEVAKLQRLPKSLLTQGNLDAYSVKALRQYAASIGMTGASKIPGGKPKLLDALMDYIKRHPSL